jgi:hypothetical protein
LFPAVGEYATSPDGVVLPTGIKTIRETILADLVTITQDGQPRFAIIIKITDISSGEVKTGCALAGRTKTASDTHLVFGHTSLPAYDSSCQEDPSLSRTLEPGTSSTYFVAFYLPPGLGTQIRLTSVFAPNGKAKTYSTARFHPYGGGTDLKIVAVPQPSVKDVLEFAEKGWDLATELTELAELAGANVALPEQPVDIELLGPWTACAVNDLTCLQQNLPTPYLPELEHT